MRFAVATAHGILEATDGANDDPSNPRQGLGQSSRSGVMLWLGTIEATLAAYRKNCYGAIIKYSSQLIPLLWAYARGFMDDTTLLVNESRLIYAQWVLSYDGQHPSGPNRVCQAMTHIIEAYKNFLWTLGGQLSLPKCFYYLISFIWTGIFFHYAMKNEVISKIKINTSTLNPTQEETPDIIQRLEPDDT